MTRDDDSLSIEELRQLVEQDPRGTWVEPEADTSTIIVVQPAPRATNGPDAPSGRHDE
jgi:hypothetical protein